MWSRRQFLQFMAGISTGGRCLRGVNSNPRSITIAVHPHVALAEWAASWSETWFRATIVAGDYLRRAVHARDGIDQVRVVHGSPVDLEAGPSMQAVWRSWAKSTPRETNFADIHLLLWHEGQNDFEYAGWGGEDVAVIRNGEQLYWVRLRPPSGFGYAHFTVSNVLHEVGHCLNIDHEDGTWWRSGQNEVSVTPMVGARVYQSEGVSTDERVRYVHRFAGTRLSNPGASEPARPGRRFPENSVLVE